jgi:RimJ/RimL family protein N-acetyltransferase
VSPRTGHVIVDDGKGGQTTPLRPGESLLHAAERLVGAERAGRLVARDLSAAPPRFGIVSPGDEVCLRPMTHGDLPWLTRWRNTPRVAKWWDDDPDDLEGLTRQYGPDISPETATRLWIAEHRGRSVGFLQDYRVGDHPEYALLAGHPDALGVDFLVGEEYWAGRGFGTRMLWAWLLLVRASDPGLEQCFAAPDHRNTASRRVLAKVGFEEGVWFDEPVPGRPPATVVGHTLDLAGVLGAAGPGRTR